MSRDFQISVPLDRDGFLRRECPTCEREFKWLPTQVDPSASTSTDEPRPSETGEERLYYCPYCGVSAPPGAWFTKAQVAAGTALVEQEVIEPELEKLERELRKLSQSSGGLVRFQAKLERQVRRPRPELTEPDDMRRVDFVCHPDEPLKVLEDWDDSVHCLVCGRVAEP